MKTYCMIALMVSSCLYSAGDQDIIDALLGVTKVTGKRKLEEQESGRSVRPHTDSQSCKVSTFIEAAIDGNLETVKKLLSEDANINQVDDKGNTALHWAVMHNKHAVVEILLNNKVDVDKKDNDGLTALSLAADEGNKEVVKLLIDAKANLNTQDYNLFKLLKISAGESGQKELVDWLNIQKIAIDALRTGYTPLMRAVLKGHEDVVKLLIDAGAHINTKAVVIVSKTNTKTLPEVKPVLTSASNLAKKSNNGEIQKLLLEKDALLKPLGNELMKAVQDNNIEIVQRLLDQDSDIDTQDSIKYTPLHYAARRINIDIVKLLLNAGAHVNATNNDGYTPLEVAVTAMGYEDKKEEVLSIIKILLDAGAYINATGNAGDTPLHAASIYGYKEIAKLLIDSRANVNVTDNSGHTPLHYASRKVKKDIVRLLIDSGATINNADREGVTPLARASKLRTNKNTFEPGFGNSDATRKEVIDILKLLLDARAHVNTVDNREFTPLHYASQNGEKDIVKLLLDAGANVNAVVKDGFEMSKIQADCVTTYKYGLTPLIIAGNSSHKDVVKLLLDAGADAKSFKGFGIDEDIMKLLKDKGFSDQK